MKDGTIQAQRLIDIPSLTGLRFIAAFSMPWPFAAAY